MSHSREIGMTESICHQGLERTMECQSMSSKSIDEKLHGQYESVSKDIQMPPFEELGKT
jgi:hypothetical protein